MLTKLAIEAVKPGPARREIPDGKIPGLYLVVQPTNADGKRRLGWAVRYRAGGVPKKFTIGPYPEISLDGARAKALEVRGAVTRGADPSADKVASRRAAESAEKAERDLVENVVPVFIERYAKANTGSWEQTERLLTKEVVGAWRGRRVQEITRRDMIELLDGLVDRGAPVQANRILAYTRKMFNWLGERDVVQANPCAGLKAPTTETSRDRVLTDSEIKLVWNAAAAIGWPFGPFIQLLILTGQRREECAGMRWDEIDLEKKVWVIPKERAKNGIANDVHLSAPALSILEKLPKVRGDDDKTVYVFTTTGNTSISGYARAKGRLDAEVLKALRANAAEAGGDPENVESPPPLGAARYPQNASQ